MEIQFIIKNNFVQRKLQGNIFLLEKEFVNNLLRGMYKGSLYDNLLYNSYLVVNDSYYQNVDNRDKYIAFREKEFTLLLSMLQVSKEPKSVLKRFLDIYTV